VILLNVLSDLQAANPNSSTVRAILEAMASDKSMGSGARDADYLERARRDALRRDYRLLTPGQRVEQAAALSKEMTSLAARRAEQA
jgi:hypothetical protein